MIRDSIRSDAIMSANHREARDSMGSVKVTGFSSTFCRRAWSRSGCGEAAEVWVCARGSS